MTGIKHDGNVRTSLVPTDPAVRRAATGRSAAPRAAEVRSVIPDWLRRLQTRYSTAFTTSHTRLAQMIADMIFDRREQGLWECTYFCCAFYLLVIYTLTKSFIIVSTLFKGYSTSVCHAERVFLQRLRVNRGNFSG